MVVLFPTPHSLAFPLVNWVEMLLQTLLLVPSFFLAIFSNAAVLVDFQVANPPPVPQGTKQCTIQILQ